MNLIFINSSKRGEAVIGEGCWLWWGDSKCVDKVFEVYIPTGTRGAKQKILNGGVTKNPKCGFPSTTFHQL